MDVLCTDKTGTLTEGAVRLDLAIDDTGQSSPEVLRLAQLNAGLQRSFTNPLDAAVLRYRDLSGEIARDYVKLDELPFDSSTSETTRIVYGKSSSGGITGLIARSTKAPCPISRRPGPRIGRTFGDVLEGCRKHEAHSEPRGSCRGGYTLESIKTSWSR